MVQRPEQASHQRRYTDGKQAYEKNTKHMKRYSRWYAIREVQIKAMRYYYTPSRKAKVQNTDNTEGWWRCRNTYFYHTIQQSFFLVFTPKHVYTKTCTWLSIAALFLTVKTWRQPRWPSVGEWINTLQYIQAIECYSVLQRSELSSHVKTWRNLNAYS